MIDNRIQDIHIPLKKLIALRYYANGLDLRSHRPANSTTAGLQTSSRRGRGMDFDEVRRYQPGDDIRCVDWRVTARTGKAHTKLYREEKERPVYFIVDFNPAMYFGSKITFKSAIASQATALLAWAACAHGDRVGGFVFNHQQQRQLPPQLGNRGVLPLLKTLVELSNPMEDLQKQNKHVYNLTWSLQQLRHVAKPGSLIFLISDFSEVTDEVNTHLAQLTHGNDLVALFIYDALEKIAPPPNAYIISDGEQFFQMDTRDPIFQQRYQQQFSDKRQHMQMLCNQRRIPWYELTTDMYVIRELIRLFNKTPYNPK